MLRWAVLLQVLLWISTAHAFFPWFPASICAEDDSLCKAQAAHATQGAQKERSVNGLADVAVPGSSVKFRLARKQPSAKIDEAEPLHERVKRIAHRLTTKHGRTAAEHQRQQPRSPPTPTTADLAKRTNAFSIVSAATPSATNAAGIDQDGTDFAYFVQAAVGSAATPMYMLLDTGAGTTWVMGRACTSSACSLHNEFGPADSKTLQTSDDSFKISYGSGTVSGSLARDTLAVASLSLTMSFGLANTTSDDFSHFPFDGILGLSLSRGVTDNFWNAVQAASLLPANLFCVALWRAASGPNHGEIIFGATDPAQYTGDIVYTGVASAGGGDWAIPMDGIGYNGHDSGIKDRVAYIDTGTTYVFGPAADVATLHALIPGSGSTDGGVTYTVPCANPQPLTVSFSGVSYTIDPADWMSAPTDDSGNCTSNIYGYAVVEGSWLLGDLFLKNVYAAFDVDKKRIGFAKRPTASPSTTSSSSATSSPTSSSTANTSTLSTATPAKTTSGSSSETSTKVPTTVLPGVGGTETTAATTTSSSTTTQTTSGTGATPKPTTVTSSADRLGGKSIYGPIACVVMALAIAA